MSIINPLEFPQLTRKTKATKLSTNVALYKFPIKWFKTIL